MLGKIETTSIISLELESRNETVGCHYFKILNEFPQEFYTNVE